MQITPQLVLVLFVVISLIYIMFKVSSSGFGATLSAWTNPNIKKQILLYNGFPPGTQLDLYKLPGNVKITKVMRIGDSGTGSGPFVYYRATIDSSWTGFRIGNGNNTKDVIWGNQAEKYINDIIAESVNVPKGYNNITLDWTITPDRNNRRKPSATYTGVYISVGLQKDNTQDNNPGGLIKQIIDLN